MDAVELDGADWIDGPTHSDPMSQIDRKPLRRLAPLTELGEGPIPAILDTSYVRTGMQYQLRNGRPPRTIIAAQEGRTRIFMEQVTLNEAWQRLERFADQLDVPVRQLRTMFADDWLPNISVVSLPEVVRSLDPRALSVKSLDPDDYPAAALAALLSPCVLLTGDYHHFAPLGVTSSHQGIDAVCAAIQLQIGQRRVQAAATVPIAPVYAIGVGTKRASEKVGPIAWFILAGIVVGGALLYRRQPPERREAIRNFASEVGKCALEQYTEAQMIVNQAESQLSACLVPPPIQRSIPSAVLRALAVADDSMSAQQLCENLDPEVQPAVDPLRRWMHANKPQFFYEVRRGSFRLGSTYSVSVPIA